MNNMKRSIILIIVIIMLVIGAMLSYFFLFDMVFSREKLIRGDSLFSLYEVRSFHSRTDIPPLPFSLADPLVFTALKNERNRDLFCLYDDGSLYNLTNTKNFNEIKFSIVNKGEYIAFASIYKGKEQYISYIDLKNSRYYFIDMGGGSENLVASYNTPVIAFTNAKGRRWELIVFDLSQKRILHREYHPDNNCLPNTFSECGRYLYWTRGYPQQNKVKDIMMTDIQDSISETIIPHDGIRHEKVVLHENTLYYAVNKPNSKDREIYSYNLETKEKSLYISKENFSVFPNLVQYDYIIYACHSSLIKPEEDIENVQRRQVMQRLFDSQVDYYVRKLDTDEILTVIESGASFSFHRYLQNLLAYSVLKRHQGIDLFIYDIESDTHHKLDNIPNRLPNYPKFLVLPKDSHYWVRE